MSNILSSLPLSSKEMKTFMSELSKATETDIIDIYRMINSLSGRSILLFIDALGDCFDDRLLKLVYESKPLAAKLDHKMANGLISCITVKAKNLYVDEDLYIDLVSALIKNYSVNGKQCLLQSIGESVVSVGSAGLSNPINRLDEALAFHVGANPPLGYASISLSFSAFKNVGLHKTLEIFTEKLLHDGNINCVKEQVVELFQKDLLNDSYIGAYRKVLGDDALVALCADTSRVFNVGFKSISKVAEWAGEEHFLTDDRLQKTQKLLRGKSSERTRLVDEFAFTGADETKFPIMAAFVIANLKSILRETRDITEFSCVVPLMRMAARLGHGKQALKFMMDGMMRRGLAELIDDLGNPRPSTTVKLMKQNVESSLPKAVITRNWSLLMRSVEAVGLEAVHQLMPDIDGGFIAQFLDTKETTLPKNAVLKLFPQAKRFVLEDDLGL